MKPKKSRMGFDPNEWKTEGVGKGREGVLPGKEPKNQTPGTPAKNTAPPQNAKSGQQEKLIQVSVYLTKRQIKALKMKTALSDRAEDKDQSAIMRSALDAYLTDTLKQMEKVQ